MKICSIGSCHNLLSSRSKSSICSACRHYEYYWIHKTPAQVMKRKEDVTKYRMRLDHLSSTKHKHNK